jgi:TolA-binding protein
MSPPCQERPLIESLRDDRLGARERAQVERHLSRCADCRAHLASLERIADALRCEEPTELEHARSRAFLLRRFAEPDRGPDRRRPTIWLVAAVVAAAGGAALAAMVLTEAQPPPSMPSTTFVPSSIFTPMPPAAPSQSAPEGSASPDDAPDRDRSVPSSRSTPSHASGRSVQPRTAPAPATSARPDGGAAAAFADAVGRVGDGDYGSASERLERFSREHPGDPRVDEADYLRVIALDRAGRPEEARASARAYLAKHPNGSHRREVELVLAK